MKRWIALWLTGTALLGQDPLTLPEAVRRAVERHPAGESARAAARASASRVSEAKAGRWGRVDYAESFTRSDNPVFVFGSLLTQRQFAAANFALPALNQPDFLNNFQSLVSAEQPLWDAGRTKKSIELAQAGAKKASLEQRAVEVALTARTARAYLDAQLASAAVPVAQRAVQAAEADLEKAKSIRDAGRSTDADVFAVEVHLAQLRDALVARQAEVRVARAALNELTGDPLDAAPPLGTSLAARPTEIAGGARVERELAESGLELAKRQTELARLAWLPQVSARGAFEADRQRFVTRAGANWMAGVTLRWTPFQGGADRARARTAQEMEQAAQAQVKAADAQVSREVFQASALLDASWARVTAAESAVRSARENTRIVQDRYGAGLATMTDLLRSQVALVDSELRVLVAQHGVRVAQVNLAAARGSLDAKAEVLQ
jgi:outer membrane protein TolC